MWCTRVDQQTCIGQQRNQALRDVGKTSQRLLSSKDERCKGKDTQYGDPKGRDPGERAGGEHRATPSILSGGVRSRVGLVRVGLAKQLLKHGSGIPAGSAGIKAILECRYEA